MQSFICLIVIIGSHCYLLTKNIYFNVNQFPLTGLMYVKNSSSTKLFEC